MRINANKKIHKMKRDPYKTLLRAAGILAAVVAVGEISGPYSVSATVKG